MSEKTWERNITGLVVHAKLRKEQKRKRVDETITRLLREHQMVNFNSVANAAGVSKAYLYGQPQLRDRIEALRQQERRIKELEEENRKLKHQLKAVLGKAYDRL